MNRPPLLLTDPMPFAASVVPGYGTAKNPVKSVRISVDEFFALPEYSCSEPTLPGRNEIPGGSMWFKPDGRFPVKMWRVDRDFRKCRLGTRAKFDASRWFVCWFEVDIADPGWKYRKSAPVEFTTTITAEERSRLARGGFRA